MGIGDVEGHLGGTRLVSVQPVVAADAGDLVPDQHDEGDPCVVVDVGEAVHVAVRETRDGCEEAQIDRLLRLAGVEPMDPLGVLGHDRAHPGH